MKEFLEKLSQTGIKVLDLVDKGIDKLPDGLQMAWEALVLRMQVAGIMALVGSFIGVSICLFVVYRFYITIKKEDDWSDVNPFWFLVGCSAACGVVGISANVLFNPDYWMMAIYPDKYLISEMLLGFVK